MCAENEFTFSYDSRPGAVIKIPVFLVVIIPGGSISHIILQWNASVSIQGSAFGVVDRVRVLIKFNIGVVLIILDVYRVSSQIEQPVRVQLSRPGRA